MKNDKEKTSSPTKTLGEASNPLSLAAIDIGSNGARLLIKQFDDTLPAPENVRKLMFMRVPLRLGQDVFTLGQVSEKRYKMMVHMLRGYREFMKLYKVDAYRACATSAMRDAANGKKVLKKLEEKTGIQLEIIKGDEEAGLLFSNLVEKTDSNEGTFAYIDVGGGSTEVSIIHDGELADSHSFNIGTLRMLAQQVTKEEKRQLKEHLENCQKEFGNITIIGSGGNINKLCRLANDGKKADRLSLTDLRRMYNNLRPLTIEERMEQYGLKTDRADVIIPAAEIFLACASYLHCEEIRVPNISLADSIVDGLYKSMNSPTPAKSDKGGSSKS